MSSFLKRLSGKAPAKEAASSSAKSGATSPSSANSSDAGLEELDIPASERGDETELEDDDAASTSAVTVYTDRAHAYRAMKQGFCPPLVQKKWGAWTEDDLRGTKIRGVSYEKDKKKIDSGPGLFRTAHVDIFYTAKGVERVLHASKAQDSYAQVAHERRRAAAAAASADAADDWSSSPLAPQIVINFSFPGPNEKNVNLVIFLERRVPPADTLQKMKEKHAASPTGGKNEFGDDQLNGVDIARVRAFDTCLKRFRAGQDSYRDGKLKLIPRVAEGPFFVRKSIGRVPALMGKKIKQSYRIDDANNIIEITADVGTSAVASKIVSLVKKTAKSLVVDLTFLWQGDAADELPESILGGVRIANCNLDLIPSYDENRRSNVFD